MCLPRDALYRAEHATAPGHRLLVDALLQNIQTLFLIGIRHVVYHIGRRGARAGGEDKAVAHIEIDVGDKLHCLFEIFRSFAGEADDKVGAYLNIRTRFTQLANNRFILQRGMGASHQVQHAVGAALHRQVQEAHQLRRIAIDIDDIVGKFDRVAGGEANAVDAVDSGDRAQQIGKAAGSAVVVLAAPGVHVLAQQVDFTHTLRRQLGDFKQDIVARAADFFSAGVGHHAVGAVFIAAFHNRDKGGRAFGARFWQAIEFSISGKLISTTGLRLPRTELIISGRRCRVCGPKIIST